MRRKSRKKVKICRQRDGFSRERRLRIEARKMVGTMGLNSVYDSIWRRKFQQTLDTRSAIRFKFDVQSCPFHCFL